MPPSGAISIAVTAAHGTPPGGFAQSRTVRYGLGRSLIGWGSVCARQMPVNTRRTERIASFEKAMEFLRDKGEGILSRRDSSNRISEERVCPILGILLVTHGAHSIFITHQSILISQPGITHVEK